MLVVSYNRQYSMTQLALVSSQIVVMINSACVPLWRPFWRPFFFFFFFYLFRHGLKHVTVDKYSAGFWPDVPRNLFIRFIEWPWFNSEINHRSRIRRNFSDLLISFNFVCEIRLYHINLDSTSWKYIRCQNIRYPVQYERALIFFPCTE